MHTLLTFGRLVESFEATSYQRYVDYSSTVTEGSFILKAA